MSCMFVPNFEAISLVTLVLGPKTATKVYRLLKIAKPFKNNFVLVKLSNRSRSLQPFASCQ